MVKSGTPSQSPTPTGGMSQQELVAAATAAAVAAMKDAAAAAPGPQEPTKPKMGGNVKLSQKEWACWTGGKPKADWSGLNDTAPMEFTSPNQLHPVYTSSAQKGYNFRKK